MQFSSTIIVELHNNTRPRNNIPIIVLSFEKKAAGMSVFERLDHTAHYTQVRDA